MKELTSNFDDIEKRLAVFMGLGAFLLNSLVCLWQGADLETYLVRGILVIALVTLASWFYGTWMRRVFLSFSGDAEPSDAEIRGADAQKNDRLVDMPMGTSTVLPAESVSGRSIDFTLPEFEPVGASVSELPDLPPPPVPAGLK